MDARRNPQMKSVKECSYEVFCFNCNALFDACRSPWCECITDNPTLVCPECGQCFCNAPDQFRRGFWEGAPDGMWYRRLKTFSSERGDPPSQVGNPLRRPLILVADDEEDTRRIAYKVLEALGYGVLLAEDGEKAFELAKIYRPDLILTDQMMPHMDGRHLSRLIKEDEETRDIKVILMSGLYKRDSQRIEALRTFRADDYLTKPIAFDKLGEVLACWLAPTA